MGKVSHCNMVGNEEGIIRGGSGKVVKKTFKKNRSKAMITQPHAGGTEYAIKKAGENFPKENIKKKTNSVTGERLMAN